MQSSFTVVLRCCGHVRLLAPQRLFRGRGCVLQAGEHGRYQQKLERTMNKLMRKKFGIRFDDLNSGRVTEDTMADLTIQMTSPSKNLSGSSDTRKAKLYSHVLLPHIIDAMASEEFDKVLKGREILLTKVKVHTAFAWTDIHWLASGDVEKDRATQTLLDSLVYPLRQSLNRLAVVGHVPPIRFIGDYSSVNWDNVDRILSTADFGPGHVMSAPAAGFRSDTVLQKELSDNVLSKLLEGARGADAVVGDGECGFGAERGARGAERGANGATKPLVKLKRFDSRFVGEYAVEQHHSGRRKSDTFPGKLESSKHRDLRLVDSDLDSHDYLSSNNEFPSGKMDLENSNSDRSLTPSDDITQLDEQRFTKDFMAKLGKFKSAEEERLRKLEHIREKKRRMRKQYRYEDLLEAENIDR